MLHCTIFGLTTRQGFVQCSISRIDADPIVMTKAEIAFYRRRRREELRKAETVIDMAQKHVHLQWARYFAEAYPRWGR
jgi:hypothetical protein